MARRGDARQLPDGRPRVADLADHRARNPRIEITPSVSQYRQLCRDLAALKAQGAPSNTAAILDAVSHAATDAKVRGRSQKESSKRPSRAKSRR